MIRVCAWCNKFMGNTVDEDGSVGHVSHSICDECADNLDFQLGVNLQRYLESLKLPVILVDDAGNVLQANSAAQECAATLIVQGEEWDGKIYECAHARLPERCSHIIHSCGCTIRFTATETYTTGRETTSVPALLNGCSSSREITGDYLISTKLVNGIVHLRIDKVI